MIITVFYALILVPEHAVSPLVAPTVIWINLLICTLLFSQHLYQEELGQGVLEQWLLMPLALEWIVAAKWLVHWLVVCVPIVLLVPLLGVFLQLESAQWLPLLVGLLIGSIAMTAISSIGAAAMLMEQGRAPLMLVLVLPLLLPVLVFALGGMADVGQLRASWLMLAGLSAVALPVSLVVNAAIIRAVYS